jgi:hypothetical protein
MPGTFRCSSTSPTYFPHNFSRYFSLLSTPDAIIPPTPPKKKSTQLAYAHQTQQTSSCTCVTMKSLRRTIEFFNNSPFSTNGFFWVASKA